MFVILLAAFFAIQLTTAASAQSAPQFSMTSMCHTEAKNDPCVESEGRALADLRRDWSTFPTSARGHCVQEVSLGGPPSYAELLVCLQMTRWQGSQEPEATGATTKANQTKGQAGQKFIAKAVEGNLAEIQLGQMAQQNGATDGVRQFGQQLVADHTAANQRATAVAGQMGVTPPSEPSKQQKAVYDRMSKLSGDAFDRQFVRHMVDDHKKDVAEYQREAKRRNDPAAGYASETLPTLQKHLQTAQSLIKAATKGK